MTGLKPGLWRRFVLALGAFLSVFRFGRVKEEALWGEIPKVPEAAVLPRRRPAPRVVKEPEPEPEPEVKAPSPEVLKKVDRKRAELRAESRMVTNPPRIRGKNRTRRT